ncbi:MAG TPA: gamma-glutamyl-gamma-aminobutyrate hydrolase family protein [Williamwhitmania sp.]|nr:gamma-glutamyl-gamma-aminobutyrate hydrolase family protein [Williamwhitmania sp.]
MKAKILLLALLLFSACQFIVTPGDASMGTAEQRQILLMHPTVGNLKTFEYLTTSGIFPLSSEYKVLGVYHTREAYDYHKSEMFIKKNGLKNVKLLRIDTPISPDSIYCSNGASSLFKQLVTDSRGVIFFGGPDIPPVTYGEPTNLLTVVTDPYRHYMELSFMFHLLGGSQNAAFRPLLEDKPNFGVLGICLGMQTMNVATGGTLYQDIPTDLYGLACADEVLQQDANRQHRNYHTNLTTDTTLFHGSFHQIKLAEGGKLVQLLSATESRPFVLSSHHQCVKVLGKGLIVGAWSIDGKVIEAVEHIQYPNVLGLQFHPEPRELYDSTMKLKFESNLSAKYSFAELYPGDKGENFNRAIWKLIGKIYEN